MQPALWWKIWYLQHTQQGTSWQHWCQCEHTGVVSVLSWYGTDAWGQNLFGWWSGSDWYWMNSAQVLGQSGTSSDTPGVWFPAQHPADACAKTGIWTSDNHWSLVQQQMHQMLENWQPLNLTSQEHTWPASTW